MASNPRNDITRLLLEWSGGDGTASAELFPLVYDELRAMAERHLRRERSYHTLQRTALVHEAFLRLTDQKQVTWQSRAQFFGLASQMMRRILVDHARRRKAAKRGEDPVRIDLDDVVHARGAGAESDLQLQFSTTDQDPDFDQIDQALLRLEQLDPRQGKLVELRFFGGLSQEEAAEVLGVSLATVKREWAFARVWLQRELTDHRSG
jgi:RNA polymerase sigma factor (TIGR02999 family)